MRTSASPAPASTPTGTLTAVFTEDQVIGAESPQAPYNVIGNMDVLDITKQFNVPAEAENANSRTRVINHNAWSQQGLHGQLDRPR